MVDIAVLLSAGDAMLKAVLRPGGDDRTLRGGRRGRSEAGMNDSSVGFPQKRHDDKSRGKVSQLKV